MDGDEDRLEKLKKLSHRELEVLELVCQRHAYKQIGALLFIAEGTVQFHIGNIYQKLGIAELAKAARQRELGLFCPLLEDIPKQLPGTAPEEPEPPTPPPGVLAKVREDEPAEIIMVNVPQRRMDPVPVPTRTSWGRRLAAFTSLFVATGVGVVIGAIAMLLLVPVRERQVQIVVTATPAATPSVAGAPQTPVVSSSAVNASPIATPTRTATPGPTPTPTQAPLIRTPDGSILHFGETWVGDNLTLTAKNAPARGSFDSTTVDFSFENRTGQTLNFSVLGSIFSLETNTGKFYAGNSDNFAFNDFLTGTKRDFSVAFNVSWPTLQAVKLDPQVSWLLVSQKSFNARLPQAAWREDIVH